VSSASLEGLTSRVSSNVGPSGIPGLSKTAVTVRSPAASHAVDAQLGARQVLLDEQGLVGGPFGFVEDLAGSGGAAHHRGGRVVGAQHALAGAEGHRLDTHGKRPPRPPPDAVPGGNEPEGRLGHPGRGPALPLGRLVGGGAYRVGRVMRQAHPGGHGRGQHEHRGIGGHDRVDEPG